MWHVRRLLLENTAISDKSMSAIVEFLSLAALDISSAKVLAAGVRSLMDCPQLTALQPRALPVDGEALAERLEFPLVELDLRGMRISADAAVRHRDEHPNCDAEYCTSAPTPGGDFYRFR